MFKAQPKWRLVVSTAIKHGVAVPAFSASLAYFDSYRSARSPANLLQAQRDFFGAPTYERVDKPGVFHTDWLESEEKPAEKPAPPKTPPPHHAGELIGILSGGEGSRGIILRFRHEVP